MFLWHLGAPSNLLGFLLRTTTLNQELSALCLALAWRRTTLTQRTWCRFAKIRPTEVFIISMSCKLQTNITIIDHAFCASEYASIKFNIHDRFICAGYPNATKSEGNNDACSGDSVQLKFNYSYDFSWQIIFRAAQWFAARPFAELWVPATDAAGQV